MLQRIFTAIFAFFIFISTANAERLEYVANGDASFSAIIKGHLNAHGGDAEGGLAVGGNFTVHNSYSIGDRLSQSNGTRDDLIVGGTFHNKKTNWQVHKGNAIAAKFKGVEPSFGGNGNQLLIESQKYDFENAFIYFENLSRTLAALTDNGTVIDNGWGGLTFKGSDPTLNVFTLRTSAFKNWGATFDFDVPASSVVIINVPDGSFKLPGGSFSKDLRSRLILNLHNAGSVTFQHFLMLGTVLAPKANLTIDGGSINGHAIFGGNATQKNGGEFHNYPFTGKIIIPRGEIGDFVFLDENENGIQDDFENGISGVTVRLLDENGKVKKQVKTNSNGKYNFTDLDFASYQVQFELPQHHKFTKAKAGQKKDKDSDPDSESGLTSFIELSSATPTITSVDAGMYVSSSSLSANYKSIQATATETGVLLQWETTSETDHAGFHVWRQIGDAAFQRISETLLVNPNFGALAHTYEFTDTQVSGGTISYKLESISTTGKSEYSDPVSVDIAAGVHDAAVIKDFELGNAYPNPFNPSTTISYTLPETAYARLFVFDALGRQVAELVNQVQPAGRYQVQFHATTELASGTYFYTLQAGSVTMHHRMLLVK